MRRSSPAESGQIVRPGAYGDFPAAFGSMVVFSILVVAEPGWARVVYAVLGLHGAAWAARVILIRLHFSPAEIGIAIGPWLRTVNLTELAEVTYKRSGYTALITLKDSSGGRITINVRRFCRKDDEWAHVILDAAARRGVELPQGARASLEHADGKSGGWVE